MLYTYLKIRIHRIFNPAYSFVSNYQVKVALRAARSDADDDVMRLSRGEFSAEKQPPLKTRVSQAVAKPRFEPLH